MTTSIDAVATSESIKATYPYYAVRLAGGLLVLAGMFIMAWNTARTFALARGENLVPVPRPAHA